MTTKPSPEFVGEILTYIKEKKQVTAKNVSLTFNRRLEEVLDALEFISGKGYFTITTGSGQDPYYGLSSNGLHAQKDFEKYKELKRKFE